MILTLSGMDGSGKTTLSLKIAAESDRFVRVSRGGYFLLEPIMRGIRYLKGIDSKKSTKNPFLSKGDKPWLFKFWPWLVLADDLIHYWLVLKPVSVFYNIVCDRYMYDRLIGLKYHGFLGERAYALYKNLIPSPTKALILEVEPSIALERETAEKHVLQFYTDLHGLYRNLAKEKSIEIIDMLYYSYDRRFSL